MGSSKKQLETLTGKEISDKTVNYVIMLFGWTRDFNGGWDVGQESFKAWMNCFWAHKIGSNKRIPTASAIVRIRWRIDLDCFPRTK